MVIEFQWRCRDNSMEKNLLKNGAGIIEYSDVGKVEEKREKATNKEPWIILYSVYKN